MTTVIITSVSEAAAKKALEKIARKNGMTYTSSDFTAANSHALDVYLRPKDLHYDETGWCCPDAPLEVVVLRSNYFNEVTLLEYANSVAGRGTVKVKS